MACRRRAAQRGGLAEIDGFGRELGEGYGTEQNDRFHYQKYTQEKVYRWDSEAPLTPIFRRTPNQLPVVGVVVVRQRHFFSFLRENPKNRRLRQTSTLDVHVIRFFTG